MRSYYNNLFLFITVFLFISGWLYEGKLHESNSKESYNWIITTPVPADHSLNQSVKEFTELVEKRTKGQVKITLYEGTFGEPIDSWDLVQNNIVQLTFIADAYNSKRMPITSMLNLPFEIPDSNAAVQVIDAWFKEDLLKEITDNFKVLYFRIVPPQHIFLRDKKVTSLDEFKGLKIRASTYLQAQTLTALGATAVTMSGSEVYMSMDRRVIDGNMTAIEDALAKKLDEVTQYLAKPSFGLSTFVFVMNKDEWNKLSANLQNIIEQIAEEVSRNEIERMKINEPLQWKIFKERVEVYDIDEEEKLVWKNKVADIITNYVDKLEMGGYPAIEALELMRVTVKKYKSSL